MKDLIDNMNKFKKGLGEKGLKKFKSIFIYFLLLGNLWNFYCF